MMCSMFFFITAPIKLVGGLHVFDVVPNVFICMLLHSCVYNACRVPRPLVGSSSSERVQP